MLRLLLRILFAPFWLPIRLVRRISAHWWPTERVVLELCGALPDVAPRPGLRALLTGGHPEVGLVSVLEGLTRVAKDPAVKTVVVMLKELSCGLARAEEVRSALERVGAAGKQVVAYSESYSLSAYWVALGAQRIVLAPAGSLHVHGVGSEFTLLLGALDKVGVQAQLFSRGKYKSMRETFTETEISAENREMLSSLVGDLESALAERIARSRGLTQARARELFEVGPFRAERALENGLVDRLQYSDEQKVELGEGRRELELASYVRRAQRGRLWLRRPVRVALVRVSGNIVSGESKKSARGTRSTGSDSFRKALRQAAKSKRIRAIVLRVDSPGGSALASDLMWREVRRAVADKPVLVSMVNMAASGGYYVSGVEGVPIWASPVTLTGSIGVVGGKFVLRGLLDKLGIQRTQVGVSRRAHYSSAASPWTEEELVQLAEDLDLSYAQFKEKMAEARGLSSEEIEDVAQGRVWTGQQASQRGLVDHLGGMAEVSGALRERLQLKDGVQLQWTLGEKDGLLQRWSASQSPDWHASLAELHPQLAGAVDLGIGLEQERLLYLSPWRLRA